jgi:hypothetical protein
LISKWLGQLPLVLSGQRVSPYTSLRSSQTAGDSLTLATAFHPRTLVITSLWYLFVCRSRHLPSLSLVRPRRSTRSENPRANPYSFELIWAKFHIYWLFLSNYTYLPFFPSCHHHSAARLGAITCTTLTLVGPREDQLILRHQHNRQPEPWRWIR